MQQIFQIQAKILRFFFDKTNKNKRFNEATRDNTTRKADRYARQLCLRVLLQSLAIVGVVLLRRRQLQQAIEGAAFVRLRRHRCPRVLRTDVSAMNKVVGVTHRQSVDARRVQAGDHGKQCVVVAQSFKIFSNLQQYGCCCCCCCCC